MLPWIMVNNVGDRVSKKPVGLLQLSLVMQKLFVSCDVFWKYGT